MNIIKTLTLSALILFTFSSFTPTKPACADNGHVLLVLINTNIEESFSVFKVKETDGILVGVNIDEYQVKSGLYRIEGTSNDKLYHKNILVIEE